MKAATKSSIFHVLRIAGILVIITSVTAVLLAVINNFTAPVIEANTQKAKQEAIFSIFEDADRSEDISEANRALFPKSVSTLYAVYQGETLLGYVADVASMGFADNIGMMIGINASDNTVRGIRVMSIADTPGLGLKVAEDSYLSTFVGRNEAGAADVISGATYSSNGIINATNDVLELIAQITSGSSNADQSEEVSTDA